jgi:hypothetical protein
LVYVLHPSANMVFDFRIRAHPARPAFATGASRAGDYRHLPPVPVTSTLGGIRASGSFFVRSPWGVRRSAQRLRSPATGAAGAQICPVGFCMLFRAQRLET